MSRPINSYNKQTTTQLSSILQVVATTQITVPAIVAATASQSGGSKSLDLDTLTVKNIILLDSLITKNSADTTSPDRLKLSKGSLLNQLTSSDTTRKVLSFNNVNFEPDAKPRPLSHLC